MLPPPPKEVPAEEGNEKQEEATSNEKPVDEIKDQTPEGKEGDNKVAADGEVMNESWTVVQFYFKNNNS